MGALSCCSICTVVSPGYTCQSIDWPPVSFRFLQLLLFVTASAFCSPMWVALTESKAPGPVQKTESQKTCTALQVITFSIRHVSSSSVVQHDWFSTLLPIRMFRISCVFVKELCWQPHGGSVGRVVCQILLPQGSLQVFFHPSSPCPEWAWLPGTTSFSYPRLLST